MRGLVVMSESGFPSARIGSFRKFLFMFLSESGFPSASKSILSIGLHPMLQQKLASKRKKPGRKNSREDVVIFVIRAASALLPGFILAWIGRGRTSALFVLTHCPKQTTDVGLR